VDDGEGHFTPINVAAFRNGMYVFVNDKPRQAARDVFAVTEQGGLESYDFYRRIK
jgi:hypothetical protein